MDYRRIVRIDSELIVRASAIAGYLNGPRSTQAGQAQIDLKSTTSMLRVQFHEPLPILFYISQRHIVNSKIQTCIHSRNLCSSYPYLFSHVSVAKMRARLQQRSQTRLRIGKISIQ